LAKRLASAWRAGDHDTVAACYDRSDENASALADLTLAQLDRDVALDQLGKIITQKFGSAIKLYLAKEYEGRNCEQMADLLAKAEFKIEGDRALASVRGFNLRRRDGVWRVNNSALITLGVTTIADVRTDTNTYNNQLQVFRKLIPLAKQARDWNEFEKLADKVVPDSPATSQPATRP